MMDGEYDTLVLHAQYQGEGGVKHSVGYLHIKQLISSHQIIMRHVQVAAIFRDLTCQGTKS